MPSLVGLSASSDTDTPGLREGRACRNCAQVKERCLPFTGDTDSAATATICQRCHRLKKTCSTPAPVARKRPRTCTAVHGGRQPPTPAATPNSSNRHTAIAAVQASSAQEGALLASATLDDLDVEFKQTLLDDFRRDMADQFPFLTSQFELSDAASYSKSADYATCAEKAPFSVAVAIMAALHRHCVLQKHVAREVLASLVNAMLIHGRKSMDMLFAINILEAWYPFHLIANPQMMNLLHLGRALIVDLGLAQPPHPNGVPPRLWADINHLIFGRNSGPHDLGAGYRAMMGLYYIGSYYAITLRRSEFPHWSEIMETSCQYVEEHANGPLDVQAVHSIRLLQLAERYLNPKGVQPSQTMTVRAYVACFRADIQKFRSALPPQLVTHHQFQLDIQSLEIALYDRIFTSDCPHHAEKIEALHALLALVSNYIDAYLAIALESFPLMTSTCKGQISQVLEVLSKLSALTGLDGWDVNYVRTHLNFGHVCDRLIDKFEEVFLNERARFPDMEASQFAIYPIKVRQRKKFFEEMMAKEVQQALNQTAYPTAQQMDPLGMTLPEGFDEYLQWSFPTEAFSWP